MMARAGRLCWSRDTRSLFCNHRMVLPTFGVGLPTSIYPVQKILLTDMLRGMDSIINLSINTKHHRGSHGGGSFALSLLETVGLEFLEKHGGSFAWEQGGGGRCGGSREDANGDRCSTGRRVEAPHQCLNSPLEEPDHGRLEPAA